MIKLKKILIPVDFSAVTKNAVEYAENLVEKLRAEVVLAFVNTHEKSKTNQEILDLFRTFEREMLRNVQFKYDFKILNGNILDALVEEINNSDIDLIITGTKGKKDEDLTLSASLIQSTNCPVIVVPSNNKNFRIDKIAFATDYKPIAASEVIKPLWILALEFSAKVYLVHINQDPKKVPVLTDAAEDTLEYYLGHVDHEHVYINSQDMEEGINNYVNEKEIDLLVVLSRDHGDNKLKSENRLIAQLAAHSTIPILALC